MKNKRATEQSFKMDCHCKYIANGGKAISDDEWLYDAFHANDDYIDELEAEYGKFKKAIDKTAIIASNPPYLLVENDVCLPLDMVSLMKKNKELEAENKKLREALQFIDDTAPPMYQYNEVELRMVFKAREALARDEDKE